MEPVKAVCYCRVSTDAQADYGVSLAAQEERLRLYAKLMDIEVVAVISDRGASAMTLHRPGLQQALTLLREGTVDTLLVAKLDRLTRSVRDLGDLIDEMFAKGQKRLVSLGEQIDTRSAAGRLVLNVLISVAQWEREAIAERTRDALRHKKLLGEVVGSVPYGQYRKGDKLVPELTEQAAIAHAKRLRSQGLSYRAVATALHTAGHTSRNGHTYDPQQVRRMFL